MSVELLKRAKQQGISISLNNDSLRVETSGKPLSDELRAEITSNKLEIIKILTKTDTSGIKAAQTKITPVMNKEQVKLPLSYSQQRLWFIDRLNSGSPEYNMLGAFTVSSDFNLAMAQSAICKIIERHNVLRTVYRELDGVAYQYIKEKFCFGIEKYDLRHLSQEDKESKLNRIINDDAHKAFRLGEDLMIRASFILLGEQASQEYGVLTINIHHIASDGWSVDIFLKEFIAIYQALREGRQILLSDLPLQYSDYAYWQKECMSKSQLSQQLNYWDSQLLGLPPVHRLPLSFPRGEIKHRKGKVLTSCLDIEHAKSLSSLAINLKMTPFMLVHATLALVLSNYSGCQDIVMGTPIANRKQSDLDSLIGFFSNSLPLRVSTAYQSLFGYLSHVRKVHIDAQDNQDVPFELLVERQKLSRNLAYTPLFQIMLSSEMDYGVKAIEQGHKKTLLEAGLKTRPVDYSASKFDLEINAVFGKHGIHIYWLYDTSLFQDEFMGQLKLHFVIALDNLSQLSKAEQIEKATLSDILKYRPTHNLYSEKILNIDEQSLLRSEELPGFPVNICSVENDYGQREWLETNTLDSQIDYWTEQLSGVPHVHSLALERVRRADSYRLAKVAKALPHNLIESLLQLAGVYQLTPFMLFHGALALVLSKHSYSNDIVIGTPVGHRQHNIDKFLINNLALRVNTCHERLNDYLSHVRQVNLSAQLNQNVPFEQLIDRLNITRCSEYMPLVQIMLTTNLGNDLSGPQLESCENELLSHNSSFVHKMGVKPYDLHVSLSTVKNGVLVEWGYNDKLFSEEYIELLNAHLCQLLTSLSEFDESALDTQPLLRDVDMLSQHEIHDLLYQRNDTHCNYPSELCIHELFELQVQQRPEAMALVHGDQKLNYQQLNDKANQLAHYLKTHHDIQPDTLVGLCVERSLEMVVGQLAILKAGGAYVPLDPSYPTERLCYMLRDAKTQVVLAQHSTLATLNDYEGDVLVIDSLICGDGMFAGHSTNNIPTASLGLTSSHLSYIIYTSGSTGKPKGVMIEHRNATSMLNWARLEYDDSTLSRTLASTSLNFDLSVFEIFAPLSTGNCCVIVKDMLDLVNQRLHITLINTVPSAISVLIEHHAIPNDVKCINLAGEPLHTELVNKLLTTTHCTRVYNLYGPSEDTTYSTYIKYSTPISESVSIGKVLANSQAYVLNDVLELVPLGGLGQLYLAGSGVARGYHGQPDLTAERFINNPFYDLTYPNHNERLYKTGDLVRYLPDGNLQYIGRLDEQVKIRGFRIELGEIESQLRRVETVDSSLVIAKQVAGSQQLVAYIKSTHLPDLESQDTFIQSVKEQIARYLPSYMLPSVIMLVEDWPLTPNGKIDKRALTSAEVTISQGEYCPPQNDTERALIQIWSKLLQLDPATISTTSNFFNLGGHSLLTTRLSAELRTHFAVEIPLQTLFEQPSLSTLANEILKNRTTTPRDSLLLEPVARVSGIAPMSFSQRRLWFIDQLRQNSPEYNIPVVFNVKGQFDNALLQRVFHTIIERHEVLRTVYRQDDEQSWQHIRAIDEITFTLHKEDLTYLNGCVLEEEIERRVVEDLRRPFDLSRDLMLRVSYLKTHHDTGVMLFNMHHIASDGWSMEILTKEFFAVFGAYSNGRPNPLPPLKVQYADYAQWQQTYFDETRLAVQLDYWTRQLADLPVVHTLPTDYSRPAVKGSNGKIINGAFSAETAQALQRVASDNQLTPFMLFHAALALLLSRHSGSHDIIIGTPVANRPLTELEQLIGFFVNTLVLRVDTEQSSIHEYFSHIRNVHVQALSHQDLPFELLVERLQVPRSQAHTPLFQIMLTTASDFSSDKQRNNKHIDNTGLNFTYYQPKQVSAKFDLNIDFVLNTEGGQIQWIYDDSLFKGKYIHQLNDHLCLLLSGLGEIASNSTLSLESLPLLSNAETNHLLKELNDTFCDYPSDLCIHEMFEHQVQRQPSALALVFEGQQLTYQQLNDKANQLAHYLKSYYNIKPSTLVGLCVERSPELVIGLLAILKAGGAYVPLDSSLPKERLSYILKDTDTRVVFAHQSTLRTLSDYGGNVLDLDFLVKESAEVALCSIDNITKAELGLRPEHLSYVIYTSGSTGKPKGIKQTHKTICNLIYSTAIKQGINRPLRTLSFTPYTFDVSVQEFATSWFTGSCLIGLAKEPKTNLNELVEILTTERIERLFVPPAVLQFISEIALDTRQTLSSLKEVFAAGEELVISDAIQNFKDKNPHCRIWNCYGPTETHVVTIKEVDVYRKGNAVPIGKPINNTNLYVLNNKKQLAPYGAIAELYISGVGLATGYIDKALDDDRFITNPFDDNYPLLYRTGDLVKYLPDGNLIFVGRTDEQVNISGFRVELKEIENAIANHDEISSCIVLYQDSDFGLKTLIAYVRPVSSSGNDEDVYNDNNINHILRVYLANFLPSYMIPSSFVIVKDFPLTANGKIDKRKLSAFYSSFSEIIEPTNEVEKRIISMFSKLLKIEENKISVDQSFFELGLSSLKLFSCVTHINQGFEVSLSISDLYENSSVRMLSKKINEFQLITQIFESDSKNNDFVQDGEI